MIQSKIREESYLIKMEPMAATGARGGNKMPPIWSAGLAYFFTAGINFFLIQLLESADSALKDRLLIVGDGVRIVIFRPFV